MAPRGSSASRHITDAEKIRLNEIMRVNLQTTRAPDVTADGRPLWPTARVKWINGFNDTKAALECNKVPPMLPDGTLLPPLKLNSVCNYRSAVRGKTAKKGENKRKPPAPVEAPAPEPAQRSIPVKELSERLAALVAEQVQTALAPVLSDLADIKRLWA